MKNILKRDTKKTKFLIASEALNIDQEGKHIVDFIEDFPFKADIYDFYIDYRLTQNYHDYLEIAYIFEGSGTGFIGDQNYPAKKGDIFIFNNVELHTFSADHNENLIILATYFLPEFIYKPGDNQQYLSYLRPFYYRGGDFKNHISAEEITGNIPRLIKKMHRKADHKEKYYKLSVKTCLQELLLCLLYYYDNSSGNSTAIYDKRLIDIDKLKNTFILIMNGYNQNISLGEAARSACMSPHYFCRFFKKVTGNTFKEYLLRIRIDKAKELLLKYNMSVTEIAYTVGFENLSYFFRVFKRFTGFNPMEFKTILKNS